MRKTVFTIGEVADAYVGYTSGRLWNGWATPHFELAEAMRVMQSFNECAEYPMQYDEVYDQFYIMDDEELEIWKGENCQTTEGMKHLYGIGAYSWVWDEEDSKPIAEYIADLFEDYDFEIDQQAIAEKLKDFNTFKNVLIILRSDVDAETTISKIQEELQC